MRTALRTSCAIAAFVLVMLIHGTARADVVLEWNTIMLTTAGALNPFAQARVAAITQLAVFEAVNACTNRHTPYLREVTAPDGASPDAAAIAAAHGVLQHFFPANTAALDAARAASLSAVTNGPAKSNGITVGELAAAAMIARRAADGSSPAETFAPDSAYPGLWQPTPPQFGPGILLHWRNLTPFAIKRSDQFRSVPPPSLRSRRYARDYNEVMRVGSSTSAERDQDRTDVARYFAVVSAVHAWNSALHQVASASRRSISENARAFALLNMAISDALVSSMETKYF